MRKVAIVGIGHTVFGNLSDFDLVDIMSFASANALDDADLLKERKIIEQVFVANMGGGIINHQTGIASALVSRMDLEPAMAELVENGPASGSSALKCGGMFTRLYMERYGLTERELALVAVKDHKNGALNPYAHVRIPVTIEAIHDGEDAPVVNNYIAEPVRLYSTCPVSDGAASLILCALDSPHYCRNHRN